jgi:WD40 repeat protein
MRNKCFFLLLIILIGLTNIAVAEDIHSIWLKSGATHNIESLALSPDGNTIAAGSTNGWVKLWDIKTGKFIKTLIYHDNFEKVVHSVAFSPNGKLLAIGRCGFIELWDTIDWKFNSILKKGGDYWDIINSLTFSPDGKTIASGTKYKSINLWDISTGKLKMTLNGHKDEVLKVVFSPDGKKIASGSKDNTIKIWDSTTFKLISTFEHQSARINAVTFSPNGEIIASGSGDGTIKLWDVSSGKLIKEFLGQEDSHLFSLVFSTDGKKIITGTNDFIKIWDIETGEIITTIKSSDDRPAGSMQVILGTDKNCIISGSTSGLIEFWDIETGDLNKVFKGSAGGFALFNSDGTISSYNSANTQVWDVKTQTIIKEIKISQRESYSSIFSSDKKVFAIRRLKNSVVLWDVSDVINDQLIITLAGLPEYFDKIAISSDKSIIATGLRDGSIILWNTSTGEKKIELNGGHKGEIDSIAFSLDGKTLISGGQDSILNLWDVATGKIIKSIKHSWRIPGIIFNSNGKTFATLSDDIKLFEFPTCKLKNIFTGDNLIISAAAFSPNGKLFAAGDEYGVIFLWDVATGRRLSKLNGHSDIISSLSFSPDGNYLVSTGGNQDGSLILWTIK